MELFLGLYRLDKEDTLTILALAYIIWLGRIGLKETESIVLSPFIWYNISVISDENLLNILKDRKCEGE